MKKIKLSYPVASAGAEVTEISMRRPKVGDMLVGKKQSDEEKEVAIFANLCQITPEAIREMDLGDYKKLQEAFQGFFS